MRVCRAMLVLSVMVVLLGGCNCCPAPPEESSESNEEITISELKEVTSKAVFIRPLDGDTEDCTVIVHPEERRMGTAGIEWVTFVNETAYDATIKFVTSDAIGNVIKHEIKANEAKTFKLIDPAATGVEKKYEYTVEVECYTPPLAGPKIIIP